MANKVSISAAQLAALDKLGKIGRPATCKEIAVRIETMQALKSRGLVTNIERFGGDSFGNESDFIHWQKIN